MRLLSLCSLAAEHEEIPYAAIVSTLKVQPEEVESWVIQAVSSGLILAKMDQLQQVVMVERCVVRRFGIEEWKSLQARLHTWKKNVRGVLEGLKQSQTVQTQQ
jgi:translation initiation factor 3 subunit M